ncbi:MAG: glycosyltransferase family 8 protein [Hyphomonadaceae bacterium]|nr:glycosyltransferase family 8 protein [Hyphomonadaceae bacterium]
MDTVNVAFGFDRAYAPHAAALIASLRRHTRSALSFFMLHADVDRALQQKVEAAAPEADFMWREIGSGDVPPMADHAHFTRAILFRLGLERLAPASWSRVLYLDVDMIATADIRPLWRSALDGAALGAVSDCYVDAAGFARSWTLPLTGDYFNSGMLLIDLDQVRRDRLFEAAIEFAARNQTSFTDQDALNYVFWGRWRRLDARWNVQRHMVIPALIRDTAPDKRLGESAPAIIHFTGPEKPWLTSAYHPHAWLYWDNLRRTRFYREVMTEQGAGLLHQARLLQRYLRAQAGTVGKLR